MKAVILPLAVFALIGWTGLASRSGPVGSSLRPVSAFATTPPSSCKAAAVQIASDAMAIAWLRGFGKLQTGKKCDDNGNSPGHAPYAHICGGPMTAR